MENNSDKAPCSPSEQKIYGNPEYGPKEDIYNQDKKVNSDFEDLQIPGEMQSYEALGQDLEIPGADLDKALENIREEDEENNYYSLAGDDYNNLDLYAPEEDKDYITRY